MAGELGAGDAVLERDDRGFQLLLVNLVLLDTVVFGGRVEVGEQTGGDGGVGLPGLAFLDAAGGEQLGRLVLGQRDPILGGVDRKSTRLNSSHLGISYAVF